MCRLLILPERKGVAAVEPPRPGLPRAVRSRNVIVDPSSSALTKTDDFANSFMAGLDPAIHEPRQMSRRFRGCPEQVRARTNRGIES